MLKGTLNLACPQQRCACKGEIGWRAQREKAKDQEALNATSPDTMEAAAADAAAGAS